MAGPEQIFQTATPSPLGKTATHYDADNLRGKKPVYRTPSCKRLHIPAILPPPEALSQKNN